MSTKLLIYGCNVYQKGNGYIYIFMISTYYTIKVSI